MSNVHFNQIPGHFRDFVWLEKRLDVKFPYTLASAILFRVRQAADPFTAPTNVNPVFEPFQHLAQIYMGYALVTRLQGDLDFLSLVKEIGEPASLSQAHHGGILLYMIRGRRYHKSPGIRFHHIAAF
ncbi:MAG: hypothetical protein IH886_14915 [Nitrospinae bacterium]|nr:hypothetical protein [Nitrospinota bacterium]